MLASIAVWTVSCGRDESSQGEPTNINLPPPRSDGGTDAGTDAGTNPDAGSIPDAGIPDAGNDGGVVIHPIVLPTADHWAFWGPQQGGPSQVLGVTADEGGNTWVAGGEEGLFLLKPGESTFQRFTMADGLHPYGYNPDGTDVPEPHYLNVISVSGGPANTVFVGYLGRTTNGDIYQCENNWDVNPAANDPSIYKSGDADRVTLTASGLSVVHYDIFSGPGMVKAEPEGRERLCNIWRVKYIPETQSVWFGGNHGFAWGDPNFPGIHVTGCTGSLFGNYGCSGLLEHAHPGIEAYTCNDTSKCPKTVTMTDAYRGIASDPGGGMWIGGYNRSLHYNFGYKGQNFWSYESQQFDAAGQLDVWPDAVKVDSTPNQRTDDAISGIATTGDGTAWFASFNNGVAHVDSNGFADYFTIKNGLIATQSSAIAADPSDGSIWIGAAWGGGLTRIQNGQILQYSSSVFGKDLTWVRISDIQVDTSTSPRRILVAFQGSGSVPGAIGIYTGP